MLDLKEPTKCRLILAVMWQPSFSWINKQSLDEDKDGPPNFVPDIIEISSGPATPILTLIERAFGSMVSQSSIYPFDFSDYYTSEMGANLKKCFVEIEGIHARDQLLFFKNKALSIERQFAVNGCRVLNIDPLFLSLENIIISTTKNYSHRVYLAQGIYADLAFTYREKHYQPLPWTYSDYVKHVEYFEAVRKRLKKELD